MVDLKNWYFAGSILSFLSGLFVVYTYAKFKELRKHPSSLLFWQIIFNIVFSLQFIILFFWEDGKKHCEVFSLIFQFTVLGSQSWFVMIAVDLLFAMRDPFTQPSQKIRYYHVYVWGTSALSALIIAASQEWGFREGMEVCWIQQTNDLSKVNVLNWILFFVPTLVYYAFSLVVTVYAHQRLSRGLDETFAVRSRVLEQGKNYVIAFSVYWTVAGVIYFNVYLAERDDDTIEASNHPVLYALFAFILAVRGLVDVIVWTLNQGAVEQYRRWRSKEPPVEESADINRALRKEVILFSTQGICQSVDTAAGQALLNQPSAIHFPTNIVPDRDSHLAIQQLVLQRDDGNLSDPVPFLDFAPQVFRHLRHCFGIHDEDYKASILGDTNTMIEKFTEGASGSFFYFSSDRRYIVKTLTNEEADFLIEFLPAYVGHMTKHPHSLISKLLGFHSIKLYTVQLYFVVMHSVFQTNKTIHTRYDLKGSWVNRHAKRGDGLLKDNDLNHKISLPPKSREMFLEHVQRDARFLHSQGIMDYSLLLGISNTKQLIVRPQREAGHSHSSVASVHSGYDERKVDGDGGTVPFYRDYHGGLQALVIEGPGIYYFGIIDILQRWDYQKRCESCLKVSIARADPDGLSAVPPTQYMNRFIRAMHSITEPSAVDDDDEIDKLSQEELKNIEMMTRQSLSRMSDNAKKQALAIATSSSVQLDLNDADDSEIPLRADPPSLP